MKYHEWTQAAFEAAKANGVTFDGGEFQRAFVGAIGTAWNRHKSKLQRTPASQGRRLAESYLTLHPESGTVEVR